MNGVSMSPHLKWGIAGVVVGLILWIISPWVALAVIAAAIAIPTAAWFMLDESQRRRYRELRRRQRELH
jgi:Flp pilus assembly protein TadB